MKKFFAIQSAKQLLNTPNFNLVAKHEESDYLRLADKGKDEPVVCCPTMPKLAFSSLDLKTNVSFSIA